MSFLSKEKAVFMYPLYIHLALNEMCLRKATSKVSCVSNTNFLEEPVMLLIYNSFNDALTRSNNSLKC